MTVHTTEVLEPEDLVQLGSLFNEVWDAAGLTLNDDVGRARLANILLTLYSLRQLNREQMVSTALRLLGQSANDCRENSPRDLRAIPRAGSASSEQSAQP